MEAAAAEGYQYRRPGVAKVSVTSGVDWFDLTAEFDYGGQQIALPRLLGQDEELGDVDGARSECVATGTGHHGLGHGEGPADARDEHRDVGRGISGLLVRPQSLGEDLVRHQVGSPHRTIVMIALAPLESSM